MSYKVLNDAVGLIRDETPMWEGSYQELPDKNQRRPYLLMANHSPDLDGRCISSYS